jgi:electron transfer flavoprotein alpha subunit
MASDNSVLVIGEAVDGALSGLTTELIGAARRLADGLGGGPVGVALIGDGVSAFAQEAIAWGANTVYVADDPGLSDDLAEPKLEALDSILEQAAPATILIGQTALGRDLAPRLAFHLNSAVAMDCIDLEVRDGRLFATRPCYGGSARATYSWNTTPQIATVRAKSQEPLERNDGQQGEVVNVTVDSGARQTASVGKETVETEGVRIEDADVVVSGGRGLGGPEGFEELEKLAQVFGGAVGASRAVVDLGWYPVANQVGLTGKVVTPDLYVAVGISGASQHMAGCAGSKCIVAINKDKDATIFKQARYGVVADWKAVVHALTEAVRALKA